MFGTELYGAFRSVKRVFDPGGLFNPGRIVDAPDPLDNLRVLTDAPDVPEIPTRFDYAKEGGFYRSVEMCSGVGHCRKTLTGSMCPSYMATREEGHSTRGRSNALRAALEGRLEGGLSGEELRSVMDLCLGCKACKRECPSAVDMARHKSEFLHHYQQTHGITVRNWLVAHIDRIIGLAARFSSLANLLARLPFIRFLNEKLLGFDRRRTPPRFAGRSFRRLFEDHIPSPEAGSGGEVALLVDCWTNHNEPETGLAVVEILEAAGYAVELADTKCCGRPAVSKGFLDRAVRLAEHNVRVLHEQVRQGRTVVGIEPSCLLTVRDEYPGLLRGELSERARRVAAGSLLYDEFLAGLPDSVWEGMHLQAARHPVLVHGHCHQKALIGMKPLESLLGRIPGVDYTVLDTSCCGMAGSFGYEAEHYQVSRACAERILAPAVRAADPAAEVLAPGFSCRLQIEHFTGRAARHPAAFLAELLPDG
jgi:Fe-S oxidoreductase